MEESRKLNHLAIVMDGNRRWAKKNGKTVKDGHKEGAERLSNTVDWCIEFGIKYLTVYAFSTENWKRDSSEINDIMSLLRKYLKSKENDFNRQKVRIRVIGVDDGVDKDIIDSIKNVENSTKNNDVLNLNIAFNYGGRREILDVTKQISQQVKDGLLKVEDIDEKVFKSRLYYGDTPDPDLILRTGGEYRISNFLLWEMAYSEFYFDSVLWPDFSREMLIEIINNFKNRERRYGGTIKK